MPSCKYCEASFDDEDAYHSHLAAEHEDELSRIDRRRIQGADTGDDSSEFPTGPAILVGVIGFALLLVLYVLFFMGGSGSGTVNGIGVSQTPTQVGATHLHGPINVTVDGQQIDFSQSRYQRPREFPAFHFEGGEGDNWHGHAQGITLEYAMATLGIDVTESSVSVDGTTYRDSSEEWSVSVEVNGQSVDPSTYVLSGPGNANNAQQGDRIEIVVTPEN